MDLAVSIDGTRLYAAVVPGGSADIEIRVYDATDLTSLSSRP